MTINENLIEASKRTKTIASQLLEQKHILEILSQIGKPLIIWSYALDLMVDEDIDIMVQTDYPRESAIKALNLFIEKETVQKYEFGDFVKFPRLGRPSWYIVNLRRVYQNAKWEIEIWFLQDIAIYRKQLRNYKSQIDKENTLKILHAKYERKISGQTKHDKSSSEIYEEILNTC